MSFLFKKNAKPTYLNGKVLHKALFEPTRFSQWQQLMCASDRLMQEPYEEGGRFEDQVSKLLQLIGKVLGIQELAFVFSSSVSDPKLCDYTFVGLEKFTGLASYLKNIFNHNLSADEINNLFLQGAQVKNRWGIEEILLRKLEFIRLQYSVFFLIARPKGVTYRSEFLQQLAPLIAIIFERMQEYYFSRKQLSLNMLEVAPQLNHDLRAPLANIKAVFYLLNQELGNEQLCDYAKIGMLACDNLKVLVDSFLDVLAGSNIGNFTPINFDIVRLLNEVLLEFAVQAELGKFTLEYYDFSESYYVCADRGQIRRVLFNLLSNALKYSSPGKILIRSRIVLDDRVQIAIDDNGDGIDSKHPVTEELNQIADGYGLGLMAVRNLLKINNSELKYDKSQVGNGSCFYFTLPITYDT